MDMDVDVAHPPSLPSRTQTPSEQATIYPAGLDEDVQVTWPQLPQRDVWKSSSASTPASASQPVAGNTNPPDGDHTIRPSAALVERADAPTTQDGGWRYLDHTADVQIHAWGDTLASAHASAAVALHAYMVDDAPSLSARLSVDVRAVGHDAHSLLYAVLDEFLYLFHTQSFVAVRVSPLRVDLHGSSRVAVLRAWGDLFQEGVHKPGTEVKAITYSNMQLLAPNGEEGKDSNAHIFVIVDI